MTVQCSIRAVILVAVLARRTSALLDVSPHCQWLVAPTGPAAHQRPPRGLSTQTCPTGIKPTDNVPYLSPSSLRANHHHRLLRHHAPQHTAHWRAVQRQAHLLVVPVAFAGKACGELRCGSLPVETVDAGWPVAVRLTVRHTRCNHRPDWSRNRHRGTLCVRKDDNRVRGG
jgi:hypothetical protein